MDLNPSAGGSYCRFLLSPPAGQLLATSSTLPPGLDSPIALAIACIRRFSPQQLATSRSRPGPAGTTINRYKESHFHFEFYRTMYQVLDGKIYSVPEFGDADTGNMGSIDLMVPALGWGYELLLEGSRLGDHEARFGENGQYGKWLKGGFMKDYVLLDFRCTSPGQGHKPSNYSLPPRWF